MRTHLIPVCDSSGKHRVKEELLLTDEMLFIRRLLSTDDYYRFDSVEEMKAHAIFRNMWVTYVPVYLSSSFMSSSDWRSFDPWAISSLSLYFLFNLSHTSFSSCAGAVVVYVVISFWIHRNRCHWDWPPGTLGLCGIWSPRTVIWWIQPFFLSFSYFVVNH